MDLDGIFLYSDLYSFDEDEETAKQSYEQVVGAYNSLFTSLGLDYHQGIPSSILYSVFNHDI